MIDSLDISFPEGLIIITGQTGAGKSIILGALSLLSGAKADAAAIKEGADSCIVEAEFANVGNEIRSILEENDLDCPDDTIIIRRVVSSSGRSRCFVNDCPTSVSVLQILSERLVDIHSQHKSLLVTDRGFQMSVLDFFAGNASLLGECRGKWQELRELRAALADLESRSERLKGESEYNQAQFKQLDSAKLKAGEIEELEQEQRSLSSAEQIKEALASSIYLFDPQTDEAIGLNRGLKELKHNLDVAGRYIPSLAELSARVESVRIELDDVQAELEAADSRLDLSGDRLQFVEERLSLLYTLLKKHSCTDVDGLIALRDRYAESVSDVETLDERIADARAAADTASAEYDRLADALTDSRKKAAEPFASAILDGLRFLELDRSRFEVKVEESVPCASGKDSVSFLFSANGTSPVELSKCASGGELSRIMLCLKDQMARFVGMPTLIFDEIDTGVSGSVADRMGSMICRMGANMQVFSITHLPQVAAKGNAHYVVSKSEENGRTVSTIRRIDGQQRVEEIARLLSGSVITDAAIANAKSLLETN